MKNMSKTREFTKNTLMDAFWQLYKAQDIKKITIKKLTDTAGYNRITFYEYFDDIYHVLDCIEIKILSEIEEKIRKSIGDAGNIGTDAFTEHMVSLCNDYYEYNLRLFSENGDKRFEEKLHNCLKGLLTKYIKDNKLNNKYVLEFYTSGLIGAIRLWYRNGSDIPVKDFLNSIYCVLQ